MKNFFSLMIFTIVFSLFLASCSGGGSSSKDITAFTIGDRVGVISGTDIAITMPYGSSVTSLTPTITVSEDASVSPASGVAQNFTSPVVYTVTAADDSEKAYTVTVTVAASDAKDITAFSISDNVGLFSGTNITVSVPYIADLTTLVPTISITGASVSPASGVAHDFTTAQTYTVTAANGTTKAYSVTVTHLPATQFVFRVVTSVSSETFTLPLIASGSYDMLVDWGDGTTVDNITVWDAASKTHSYATAGTHVISISGTCTKFDFSINPVDAPKVTRVDSFLDLDFALLRFKDCSNLVSIASNMNVLTHLTTAEEMFYGCSSLLSIPAGSFSGSTGIANFIYTFGYCTSLTSIPSGLFDNNTAATSFHATFRECTGLTSIPSGLFDNNVNVVSFNLTFYDCTGLTSIPSGLFNNNTAVTSFNNTFYDCTHLTSIPSGLFDYNTSVTDFSYTFNRCIGLTSIPSHLFDTNLAVTSFNSTFMSCYALATIPHELFRYNTNVTSFASTFRDCEKAQLVIDLFYQASDVTTRFLDQAVNFTNCFESFVLKWKTV